MANLETLPIKCIADMTREEQLALIMNVRNRRRQTIAPSRRTKRDRLMDEMLANMDDIQVGQLAEFLKEKGLLE